MPPWFYLVEHEQPTLSDLLKRFVKLYNALERNEGYQEWFADWWHWWTRQGMGYPYNVVAPYNARWFFDPVERNRMLELLDTFIADASINLALIGDAQRRLNADKLKIRSVQDLPAPHNSWNAFLPFDLDEHEHKWTDEQLMEKEKELLAALGRWRKGRGNKFSAHMRKREGYVPRDKHQPVRNDVQAPFKTPDIARCARLEREGKPLEPEYMPDEPAHHAQASSSANSLAHSFLHKYSQRQRAIYRV
ncbi:hypothetical protein NBRC10512_003416 [Rhodotorula toruloides]|uniref:RHTO0S18e01574g1_1 n=1 Tax=Rhodotorula toruloides TaxID=5286 RepID=A0A061BN70_RHOTO|nr:RHTO0S18e01574g1_1 [Rhodotorula toruloides]